MDKEIDDMAEAYKDPGTIDPTAEMFRRLDVIEEVLKKLWDRSSPTVVGPSQLCGSVSLPLNERFIRLESQIARLGELVDESADRQLKMAERYDRLADRLTEPARTSEPAPSPLNAPATPTIPTGIDSSTATYSLLAALQADGNWAAYWKLLAILNAIGA